MNEIIIPDIRDVQSQDFESLKETLSGLTIVGTITEDQWLRYLDQVNQNPLHKVFVAQYDDKVVGTVTCIITPRVIHQAGYVAHIEDVAVSPDEKYRSKGIARMLMGHAVMWAKEMGAYKMILDCEDHLVPFYEKFGFKKNGENCMRKDL